MSRRILLIFPLIAAGILAWQASTAQAFVPSTPPIDSPSYIPDLQTFMDSPTAGGTTFPPDWVAQDTVTAAQAVGRIPLMAKALGTVTLGIAAFDIGWKIGRTIDTKWLHLEGGPTKVVNAVVTGEYMCPLAGGACNGVGGHPESDPEPAALNGTANYDSFFSPTEVPNWTVCHSVTGSTLGSGVVLSGTWGGSPSTCMLQVENIVTNEYNAINSLTKGTLHALDSTDCASFINGVLTGYGDGTATFSGSCYVRVWSGLDMTRNLVHTPLQPFTNQTTTLTTTMSPAADPSLTTQETNDARNCLKAGGTGYTTASGFICYTDSGTAGYFNCQRDPTNYVCPTGPADPGTARPSTIPSVVSPPFTLPSPLPGETFQQYEERLRALLYVGTITVIDDAMGYASSADPSSAVQAKPGTITSITVGNPVFVTVPIFWPAGGPNDGQPEPWPGNPPVISQLDNPPITIYVVPKTWTPPVPATVPTTGPGIPPTATLDFTPLTTLHVNCSSVPFGIFCYIETVLGYFDVSPQAPGFHTDNPSGGTIGHPLVLGSVTPVGGATSISGHNYTLDAFSPYMAIIRDCISAALWIGAIWLICSRFLNLGGNGDELMGAADDGSVV